MPELWGAPLPVWAIVIISLFANPNFTNLVKRFLSIFGIVAKQNLQAETDERQYQRNRESEMFAVLKSIIDNGQTESKERDKILSNLAVALHKNTDMLSRLIDQIRIFGYNASVADERLSELKNMIQTRRLRYEDD